MSDDDSSRDDDGDLPTGLAYGCAVTVLLALVGLLTWWVITTVKQ